MTVKILAEVQPVVPPSLPGVPLAPAEFDWLEVKPYVHQATGRLAYSISARVMRAPHSAADKPVPAQAKDAA
ncbi:hypothetical protein [Microbispora sp. NPDC049125]|uniref:hypothetical protein n=1 Tax=Microbispora sp. NPDC049125 TaxID=3154929 RepID=UPI0034658774